MKNKDKFTNLLFVRNTLVGISAQFDQISCTPCDIGLVGYQRHMVCKKIAFVKLSQIGTNESLIEK